MSETVLQEAERLIRGERREDYGSMDEGMHAIAWLWNAYIRTLGESPRLTARDIVVMMILVKIARVPFSPKRDNWVDIAGYAGIGAVIESFDSEKATDG